MRLSFENKGRLESISLDTWSVCNLVYPLVMLFYGRCEKQNQSNKEGSFIIAIQTFDKWGCHKFICGSDRPKPFNRVVMLDEGPM